MTASTEARLVALNEATPPELMALSVAALWNQTEEDWRMMLALGQGWGLRQRDEAGVDPLVASIVVLPYGAFAWVSMVLVLPAWRDQGHASRLLRVVFDALAGRHVLPVLDATPAGHPVYLEQGFADCWGFARWRCKAGSLRAVPEEPASPVRALGDADWPAVDALDTPAFGASRLPLLRRLAERLPQAAWVAPGEQDLRGYLLGRDGRTALQLGPLVAADDEVALALLRRGLQSVSSRAAAAGLDLVVDLREGQAVVGGWLQQRGFEFERPFTRMVRSSQPVAPGEPARIVLLAGPELG